MCIILAFFFLQQVPPFAFANIEDLNIAASSRSPRSPRSPRTPSPRTPPGSNSPRSPRSAAVQQPNRKKISIFHRSNSFIVDEKKPDDTAALVQEILDELHIYYDVEVYPKKKNLP